MAMIFFGGSFCWKKTAGPKLPLWRVVGVVGGWRFQPHKKIRSPSKLEEDDFSNFDEHSFGNGW